MAAIYNFTALPYGSRIINITGSSGANGATGSYIAESIEVTRPSTIIKRTNQLGEPLGSIGVLDFATCNCTLQLATTSSFVPQLGDTFSAFFGGSGSQAIGNETFVITQTGQPEAMLDMKKITIQSIKQY